MPKEISIDSRFEDIFNNRQQYRTLYKRLEYLTETDSSFPEVKPIPSIDINLGIDDAMSYTPKDAAAILHVKPATVRRWIREGELPATRVGSKLLHISGADIRGILS